MIKTSIVLELQLLATEKNDIADLLRKALIVAVKLKLDDFKTWISVELNGYFDVKDVPAYRKIRVELKAHNPFKGLIPFVVGNQELSDILQSAEIRDPIGGLENLLAGPTKGPLTLPLPDGMQADLLKLQNSFNPLPIVRTASRNQIAGILDSVRTLILEWALKLESEGVVGDGLSFSLEEKMKASNNPNISIRNFQGILGDVSHSTVNQNLTLNIKKGDLKSLKKTLAEKGLNKDDLALLEKAISNDPTPMEAGKFGTKVSEWVGKMLSKASNGSWAIAIGAAGELLATALSKYYGLRP